MMGLMGYIRSSVRLFWHVNEIVRDNSPWAYTHTVGFAANMISFNVGVELGQLIALSVILAVIIWWRKAPGFARQAVTANAIIMAAGFLLMGYQLAGYFTEGKAGA